MVKWVTNKAPGNQSSFCFLPGRFENYGVNYKGVGGPVYLTLYTKLRYKKGFLTIVVLEVDVDFQ